MWTSSNKRTWRAKPCPPSPRLKPQPPTNIKEASMPLQRTLLALACATVLAGCASLSPDGGASGIQTQAAPSLKAYGVDNTPIATASTEQTEAAVKTMLTSPLTMDTAVRIALLSSPQIAHSMAQLRITEADRVQAATLPNPHFSFMRAVEGDKVMLERALGLNIMSIIALPWRSQWQGQQLELAKLQAAQEVIRLAADTRKAWISAVAAQQTAQYAAQAKLAAEAAGELARRLARVGNWSKLNQAKEQAILADAATMQAKAENMAFSEREKLIRLMGLWGEQTQFKLPDRLPDLPAEVRDSQGIESQALSQRLDVRAAAMQADYVAKSLGYVRASGFLNALDLKLIRETTTDQTTGDKEKLRGWELELPIPIFDWGGAANARTQATYMQSVAQVRKTAITARSEAREAWHSYRTAHDIAKHYRDEIVPLRKYINDETLLRYNGMLIGVFELLSDTRTNILTVSASIDALRDFWLIETDLQTALTGTSPGGLAGLQAGAASGGTEAKGH
ncbi:MAG: TolC family protein [Brachymonas sp.]|nr:TolC family protein [Brachymonas sp.]